MKLQTRVDELIFETEADFRDAGRPGHHRTEPTGTVTLSISGLDLEDAKAIEAEVRKAAR